MSQKNTKTKKNLNISIPKLLIKQYNRGKPLPIIATIPIIGTLLLLIIQKKTFSTPHPINPQYKLPTVIKYKNNMVKSTSSENDIMLVNGPNKTSIRYKGSIIK